MTAPAPAYRREQEPLLIEQPGKCACGCGQPARRRFAVGHYLRQKKPFNATRHTVQERGYESPCWIWNGATRANGYGSVQYGGAPERAHRAYYRHFVGCIPEGLTLDHLCRVTNCVNPEHLEPVTNSENVRRANEARPVRKTVCKYGHELTPENTYCRPGRRARHCRLCRRRLALECYHRKAGRG